MNTCDVICGLLRGHARVGTPELIEFMTEESDFFTAPASTQFHNAYIGGLADHSLSVYNTLRKLDAQFGTSLPDDSMIVTALLHDICKTNFYVEKQKWRKDDHGKWESYNAWAVEDQLPLGHGEKSLYLISRYIKLSDAEAAAVRWHMVAFDAGIHFNYPSGFAFRAASDKYPLVSMLFAADYLSSQIIEVREENK